MTLPGKERGWKFQLVRQTGGAEAPPVLFPDMEHVGRETVISGFPVAGNLHWISRKRIVDV